MTHPVVYIALQDFCREDEAPLLLLREAGCEVRQNSLGRRLRREEMPGLLEGAVAVLAGLEPYDEDLFYALPSLRCISRCGIGTDAIDLVAAARHQVTVLTTPDEVVEPVAQLVMAMIFALARDLPLYVTDAHQTMWKRRTGVLLSEWTIGLVGFGRIGQMVERCLRPCGPRVLVTDPVLKPGDLPPTVEVCSLESLLRRADLVSLHVNRPREDGVLIGRDQLAVMKQGSRLVNTARGYLIDEEALYQRLVEGHVAGAALDVFHEEPYAGALLRLPQVLCTPHIGSLTRASRIAMELRCAQQAVEFLTQSGMAAAAAGRRS